MMTRFWKRTVSRQQKRSQTNRARCCLEQLEDRSLPSAFTAGNIAVLDLAAASTNTTGSIVELNPSTAGQSTPVQTISIASTGTNAIRFSDSGTSSFVSDTNDRSLLAFGAYNTTNSSVTDLATLTTAGVRAVGTLDVNGNFTLQTTYTESTSGDQTRSATSTDDSTWYITDKGGLFTNGATSPSLSTNILDARSFGGTVYVSSTKAAAAVSTVASPTASSLSGLPGLATDGSIQDFYLIQSGSNGSTYDILYTLDQGSSSATINKYSLVSGTWVSNGSVSGTTNTILALNAGTMIAENDGGGGAFLFVTTTKGTANNSVARLTDTAGYNQTIAIANSNNVTLYTDTANDFIKGLDFVPSTPTAPTASNPTSANVGINSATLGGTVTSTGSPYVTGYGVVYSLTAVNPSPTIGGTGVTQVAGSGSPVFAPFTVGVSGLQGTSGYSYAAYATNSAGTTYSSVATFTTQSANPPTVDTPTDTSITSTSATLGGTVESDGGATITRTGVVYALTSANSNPQIGGSGVTEVDTSSPVGSGAFTVSATGLSSGSGYTFEAFAINSSGTSYTAATTFTTLAAPTVTTPTFTDLTSSSATLGANVVSDGGSSVTGRGVVYALTSVNSNPQIGGPGVTEVDATGTTGVFTVSASSLAASSGYTFEAFATNAIGTSYTAATNFTTAAPGVITAWTFPTTAAAPDNSPTPTYGTGTVTVLGMTNNYTNANGTGNTANADVLSTSGTANANFTENLWRIRGTPNNGWALAAPQYSQGIELDTSTVGYSSIVFSFDWYSTTQGIRDLQVQYNTGSGWVNYQGPSPTGTFIATSNDYHNSGLSPVNPTIYINLSSVPAANDNPDLGIRLVSAYDSTGTLGNEYASATSTPGNVVPYNNSSGNWRFGNLTFSAGTTTTTAVTASPTGAQNLHGSVTFTATVTPASGSQYSSGTVAFYDGNTQIGTTQTVTQVSTTNVGTASITITTLAAGIHGDITAQYTPASGNGLIASGSSMNLVAGDPTDNPISYIINAPQATGVDVSPAVGEPFTGVVATFSDGIAINPSGFTATINWGDGHTSSGVVAFSSSVNETNINGQIVDVRLFTVTGTHTYAAAGSDSIGVTITDPGNNSAMVNATARVAYPPLVVTDVATINATYGTSLANQTVATFTDPGLVATAAALGIGDVTTQFSASINWGDNSAATTGSISYNSGVFGVSGSHTYAQAGHYSIAVAVTPLTVSVSRVDSSDPNSLNEVGDEDGNGITDSPSAAFIDQFALGGTNQSSLYTFSLPTVQTTSGNAALTYSSFSKHEGALNLSTNGQYLVIGGYNLTVNAWGPQSTFSQASVINRVIGTISGAGVINTTTALTDAYSGDNFRDVVSTNGTQFWTAGNATDSSNNVHYATLGATTSTVISGLADANNIAIFNGQLYAGLRQPQGAQPAGIYQIGAGLPTTAGQTPTLFIQVPQSNALDATDGDKSTSPSGLFMADLNDGNPTINGVNVAYIADSEMGIARYDYTSTGWKFSYYINSTGSFLNSAYTVDSSGNVTPTASFNAADPAASADPTKAGGVRELTGRVVNGQVQLFAVTGFGTGANPSPTGGTAGDAGGFADSVISLTDTGANSSFTVLATNTGASIYDGVAFTPTQTVSDTIQVSPADTTTTLTTTGSPTTFGQVVTFTATVTANAPSTATPTGIVSFYDNGILMGTSDVSGGVAALSTGDLSVGSHSITASLNANANFNASPASNAVSQQVNPGKGGSGAAQANGDVFSLPENSPATALNVLANDQGTGLSITGVTQAIDGTVVITGGGTGLTYQPDHDFNGIDTFTYTITDASDNTSTATVIVAVTPVNQPPTITAPASAIMLVDNHAPIAGVAVADVDANGGQEKVTLSAGVGTLSLGTTTGLTFSVGTGTANKTMTFTGTLTSLNNALAGLTYQGATDTSAPDTVTLTINDQGNSGAGGPMSTQATINITPDFNTALVLNDPFRAKTKALVINGTSGSGGTDTIVVNPGPVATTFLVRMNGGAVQTFTGVTGRILVFGQNNNNTITISSKITKQTLLVGGTGNDTITGGSGTNFISGGPGNNTLTGGTGGINTLVESGDFNMTLKSGTTRVNGSLVGGTINDVLTRNTFQQALLTAGTSNDTLDASGFAGNVILVGGGGKDVLTGGSGRNILIGGSGASTLTGGKNEDLLIGGTTAFDHNVAALSAIMAEWSQTATPYATQIKYLLGTLAGGRNGTVLLVPTGPNATVFDNGLADTLTGGLGLDWFFKGVDDTISDLNNGGKETVTSLP